MKTNKKIKIIGLLALSAIALLSGCSSTKPTAKFKGAYDSEAFHSTTHSAITKNSNLNQYSPISKQEYQDLAQSNFQSGKKSYFYINHDKSTLNPTDWKSNHVIYQQLDRLNRTSTSNTGYLERRNLANSALRVRQYIEPSGWHYNHGKQLYNRGHLIAYSLSAGINQQGRYSPGEQSGDQNNPRNLFTQTAYTNQRIQTIYENKVRQALERGKKVIFSATPIFRGSERMARGINLQAISTDKQLNFNVYIYNVEPGYQFNYQNGKAKKNRNFIVDGLRNYDSDNWNKAYKCQKSIIQRNRYLRNCYLNKNFKHNYERWSNRRRNYNY
ncbi:DNA/RNA non-specific endonuclease [Lactobacillus crispatus]|uniref:DNA/RNA non-specific endonuclease n=2 Tax=Lactobacillus crispatus TaxID=47770 RepID=A0AAW8WMA0_9LACO|nr:DNA/RNA non-specific endonuclease [Lactobacillus crispatus]MCZ3785633.1 DNA/RNA non-specific endonuclease [Lactobacillus crispatus]MCZ3793225.1 DNA/RNA non-specific endonuclease [Lactobacillus crispatus]MDT9609360.1 DNA/RNA non-specific endonuclease [Lactobacillus crispatus]MDT9616985.1 DNA/RNA non-specific endonuclease [Lactobacillus crispatus]MDX5062914.1 DNA/RNA non-specific endonuclease [Lactobacillus crispatus]